MSRQNQKIQIRPYLSFVSSTEASNNASLVNITSSITVKFSEAVDPNSILVDTNNSDCTGTFQISKDDFSTCLQLKPVSWIITEFILVGRRNQFSLKSIKFDIKFRKTKDIESEK
ncbi:Ig-like domain-containing protein [Leptospira licerasiae]|uniref:Ig-like domain-containing protein n=1 Tax=Leptospira licerasiae TaxID=447106 RepID=UPI00301B2088